MKHKPLVTTISSVDGQGETPARFLTLLAAILVQLNIGSLYAWNKLSSSLMETYEFSAQSMGVVFGVAVLFFTGIMIPVGKRMHRFSPRVITLVTMVLYSAGFVVSSMNGGHYWLVLLGNGILVGLGTGIGYISSMTFGIAGRKRKGIPTGLLTMSFALGSVISAEFVALLMDRGASIGETLRWLGVAQASLMGLSLLLYPKKRDITIPVPRAVDGTRGFSRVTMALLCGGMFSATFGGLLVNSNMEQIVGTLAASADYSNTVAIWLFSGGNALGRILLGLVPLKRFAMVISSVMATFAMLLLWMLGGGTLWLLYGMVLFVGVHFGTFFVLFPMLTMKNFGNALFSKLYPMIFLAYGIAAFVSATMGGALYDALGSPKVSLIIAAVIELIGAGLVLATVFRTKEEIATSQ